MNKFSQKAWRSAPVIALTWLALIAGCGGVSEAGQQGPVGGASGAAATPAATCAGADLSELSSVVYVAVDGADGPSCGTTTGNACKTIQQGIDNCAATGCGVLVRHGLYPTGATITLRDAVSVYGSCLFDGEADRKYRTTIQASPAPGMPAISAGGINAPTTVSGLVVIGKDETADGTASIAMVVSDSQGLTLTSSVLAAGKGGDGAAGAAQGQAPQGGNGITGMVTVGSGTWSGTGGSGGPACTGGFSGGSGGKGADKRGNTSSGCFITCNCTQYGGSDGDNGAPSGSVSGGSGGGPGSNGLVCTGLTGHAGAGGIGNPGAAGQCSNQGGASSSNIWGSLSNGTWVPSIGGSGNTGDVGSGGGGGGAGGVCAVPQSNVTWTDAHGIPGSGGGGGGCGGGGGLGGQQGGASISLLLVNSHFGNTALAASIIPGRGGVGGNGGQGGTGGPGGIGASAPFSANYDSCTIEAPGGGNEGGFGGNGGAGGNGGPGGAGSGGAGGNGGPSIGIALRGNSPEPVSSGGIYRGNPGTGGPAGSGGANPNCTGALGAAGVGGGAGQFVNLDKPAANVLSEGQALIQGQSRTSTSGIYELILQADGNFCFYKSGGYQWCSEQVNLGTADKVTMQSDGNLCLSINGSTTKCTNTAGHPGAYLAVRDDGHVVIYDGSATLWTIP